MVWFLDQGMGSGIGSVIMHITPELLRIFLTRIFFAQVMDHLSILHESRGEESG